MQTRSKTRGQRAPPPAAPPPAVSLLPDEKGYLLRSLSQGTYNDKNLQHLAVSEHPEGLITEYLRFMWMKSQTEAPLSPSKVIDALWHIHIVNTPLYEDFCQTNFGKFLHHTPFTPPLPVPPALMAQSIQHFGAVNETCWKSMEEILPPVGFYGYASMIADCG